MTDDVITKSGGEFELQKLDADSGYIEAVVSSIGNKDVVNDVMAKGAFDTFIKEFSDGDSKLPMLLQHSQTDIIGEWTSFETKGDLIIGKGQIYTETNAGSDARAFVKRGLIGSTSIGFVSRDFDYKDDGGRVFNEVNLIETSLVIRPANSKAQILSAKTENGDINIRHLEKTLRDAGLSRSQAKAFVAAGKDALREEVVKTDARETVMANLITLIKETSDV